MDEVRYGKAHNIPTVLGFAFFVISWVPTDPSDLFNHIFQGCYNSTGEITGIILCMHPANERQRYYVMPCLIGWAHTKNDPWDSMIASVPVK